MLIDRIVCAGIGQCGSNIVTELEKFYFNPFYINTSLEDLDTINTDKKNKYHIKGTKGMAKDRNLAMDCILSNNNAENIAYAIHDQYPMADIIYLFYSLGGGTGGTMGNIIAETTADLFKDKIINVVAILPGTTEDIGLQANAIQSLEQLKSLQQSGIITQLHLLDNNTREDIFSINWDFSECFDRFVNFNEITKSGNLDEEEKERLLIEPGLAVMLHFFDNDFGNGLAKANENTIYAKWLKNPRLHGLILNKNQDKDINKEVIKDVLGMATFTHQSVCEEDNNILFAAGMSFNENILANLKMNAKTLLERKRKLEEEAKKEIAADVQFDTSEVINSNRRRTVQNTQSSSSRRRGERRASSALDKYRKM